GLYYGVLAMLILSNLLRFVAFRERAYLYYVFDVGAFTVYQLSLSGLLTPWIPARWAGAALWSVHVSAVTAGTADTMFLRSFVRTRDQLPRFDVLLRLQIATTILLLLLPVFGIVRLSTFVLGGGLVATAAALGVIVACVLCWRKGDRLAGYYLVAWSVTVV